MSNIKVQKINLKLYHVEAKINGDMSFTLTFFGKREKGKDENRLEINITLKFYWLKTLHYQLRKVARNAMEVVKDSGFIE